MTTGKRKHSVLLVMDHTPDPVDRGEKFRTRKLVEYLSERFDLGVVCLEKAGDRSARALADRFGFRLVWNQKISRRREHLLRLLGMAARRPCRHYFQARVGLHSAMAEAMGRHDIVLLENPYAFIPALRERVFVNDLLGIESEYYRSLAATVRGLARRFYYRWEHQKIVRFEADVWNAASGNVFLAEHDRQNALGLGYHGRGAVTIIPQGVDFPGPRNRRAGADAASDLFFCGNLTQPRNVDPLLAFIPYLARGIAKGELPRDFKFRISGKGAPASLREICDGKNVELLGFVPSLDDYLDETKAVFCYLPGGSGVKTKIVEAFGFGKPVICDSLSAKALPGLFELSGSSPVDSYEAAYQQLLGISRGASKDMDIQAFVRANFAWPALMARFGDFLEESIRHGCQR